MKIVKITFSIISLVVFLMACGEQPANKPANAPSNAANKAGTNTNAVSNAQVNVPTDELAAVRTIYKEQCAKCHKDNGEGGEGDFDGQKVKVPSFKNKSLMEDSDEDLRIGIEEGDKGKMPPFKDKLKPDEITGLVKFIRTEFQKK
jgi:mono/diheme cytochrome c family protein